MIKFDDIPEFRKDLKTLLKKYRTLQDDLDVVKLDLNDEPGESPPFSYRIDNLGIETCVIKVKKIACKALKERGVNSGLRLVYALIFLTNKRLSLSNYITKTTRKLKTKKE
ncbi:MAG TPA: hypothetical protein PKD51_13295 [Saprospiraceae bacterium]|nr:hypothetical protein [Saprospiraceae bacterium]